METIYHPPLTERDLDEFYEKVQLVKAGELPEAAFKAYRVPHGCYEQREAGTYMIRTRIPGGAVLPHQLQALADACRRYANGTLHVTTRQDIQLHKVLLDDIHPALIRLLKAGLSPRGGGGNTVRNVMACQKAGVCADEVFDVLPYNIAMTEFMLNDPVSYQMPRKFKITFSGCATDCALATINDVGFIAKMKDGQRGFAVYIAGGMGAVSRVAKPFEEFVPDDEIHYVAEAVKRAFDRHGNRKKKNRSRLRFLVDQVGMEKFREWYDEAYAELKAEGVPPLEIREVPGKPGPAPTANGESRQPGFDAWMKSNVEPQRQPGYHMVHIPLWLGDITADTLDKLAEIGESYGEKAFRTDRTQNMALRWVHENELASLHAKMLSLGLADPSPGIVRDMIACAGASTCQLGIGLSRNLAQAVLEKWEESGLDLHALGDLRFNISGCPNSCGAHPAADIGFFGAARRVEGELTLNYVTQLGARIGEDETRLAEGQDSIPAKNIPAMSVDLLGAYLERKEKHKDFAAFTDAERDGVIAEIFARHKETPTISENEDYYYDWGTDRRFSLADRGPGECSAGVFDLIQVDQDSAREALRDGKLLKATSLAARSMLITQGLEAKSDREALDYFGKYFLDEGHIASDHAPVIEAAQRSVSNGGESSFNVENDAVSRFIEAMKDLYDRLDPSLRIQPPKEAQPKADSQDAAPAPAADAGATDKEADLRNVGCPLNYMKTKMMLQGMGAGQTLGLLLNELGAKNVPESAEKDGYQVLSVDQVEDHWRVALKVPGVEEESTDAATEPAKTDKEADLRTVGCPLNYMKTKMMLQGMGAGQTLGLLLNELGAKNVPESAEKDGYNVLSVNQLGDHWRVTIGKP